MPNERALREVQSLYEGQGADLPLELRLHGKSTRQSHGTPIFYVDITIRSGLSLEEALIEATYTDKARRIPGFNQSALDRAARQGFKNGAFEDSEEDTGAIVEELFPPTEETSSSAEAQLQPKAPAKPSLAQKLESQATRNNNRPSAQ